MCRDDSWLLIIFASLAVTPCLIVWRLPVRRGDRPPRRAPHPPFNTRQLGLRCCSKVCKYNYNQTASVISMVQSQNYGPPPFNTRPTCLTTVPYLSSTPGHHVNSWSGNKKSLGRGATPSISDIFLSPLHPLPRAPICRECDLPPWSST